MPPSVLMLGWGFPPNVTGGLDTHVGEMFNGYQEEGVDITLVMPKKYAPEGREGIVGVDTGEGDILTRIGRLRDEFVRQAADHDIAHTHDWFGYGPGSRAKEETDITWVSTFHSLSSDRNVYPPPREVRAEQRVADDSDHLITVSEIVREDVKTKYGRDSTVIYNGFSTPKFQGIDKKAELGIDGPMLFFVGRHTDQKGIAYLLYGLKKLRDPEVTLVLGGKGHQTDQLKMFAETLGIDDQCEFVGYIPEAELGDYYASADVFVSPSLAEPFGITITEALEAGTYVVATPSGVNEILPDDCVVEVQPDSDSIAEGLETALGFEGKPEFERYEWSQVVDDTIEFYEEILASEADGSATDEPAADD